MASRTYALAFNGYWRAPNIGGLPAAYGIYCVHACTHNAQAGTVSIRKLIYIGEAGNVHDRIATHERWSDWECQLQWGEELCFNAALIVPASDRQRAEAAMIYHHKPPCHVEYVHQFPFEETTVFTSGRNALLESIFTAYPTQANSLAALLGVTVRR